MRTSMLLQCSDNIAQCKFAPGTLVAVTLRFTTREYNGQVYQDILVTDIEKLGK